LELFSFSCRDIIKLRAGRSYRCGRALRGIIRAAHKTEVFDKFTHIYNLFEPLDRLLWYFFIAELTSNFLARWLTLIYRAQHCAPGDEECHKTGPLIGCSVVNAHVLQAIWYDTNSNMKGACWVDPPRAILIPPGWQWHAYNSLQVSADPPLTKHPPSFTTFMVNLDSGQINTGKFFKQGNGSTVTKGANYWKGHNTTTAQQLWAFAVILDDVGVCTGGRADVKAGALAFPETPQPGAGCFGRPPPGEGAFDVPGGNP